MAKPIVIRAMWLEFERGVYDPISASATQREECRRAFYAGAAGLFSGIMSALDPGQEATDSDLGIFDALAAEFDEYARRLAGGDGSG